MRTIYFLVVISLLLNLTFSKIRLIEPVASRNLFKDKDNEVGAMSYTIGMMGTIDYRKKWTFELRSQPESATNGCDYNKFDKEKPENHYFHFKYAFLVKRGDCTFSQKVHNISLAGGSLTIVFDDQANEVMDGIIPMADKKIKEGNIPMVMISKKDGLNLLELMKGEKRVMLTVDFDSGARSEKPDVKIWMSPTDWQSYRFMQEFRPFQELLAPHINFTPAFRFKNKLQSMLKGQDNQSFATNCYSDGEFCVADQDVTNGRPQDVIDEAIRQTCLHKVDPTPRKTDWFNYLLDYQLKCLYNSKPGFRLEDCYLNILHDLNINYDSQINKCVQESWQSEKGKKLDKHVASNSILEDALGDATYSQMFMVPTIIINNFMFRGELDPFSVATSICDTFAHVPQACTDMRAHVKERFSKDFEYSKSWVYDNLVLLWVLLIQFLIWLTFIGIRIARDHFSSQTQWEVSNMVYTEVSEYKKMKDNNMGAMEMTK